jgi:hypothetical protein
VENHARRYGRGMTTYAVLEQIPLEIVPGSELTCGLTVRNNSDVVEAYQFELVGEPAQWTVLEPAELSVYPGTEQTVTVRFQPPRSSRVHPGEVPFAIRVLPTERPGDAVTPEGTLLVQGFTETTAEITPRTSTGRRRARHEVAIDNRGNVPIVAGVAGTDPDNQLVINPRLERVTVDAGATEFVKINVKHRRWYWQGTPVTHPFQILVTPQAMVEPAIEADPVIALDAAAVQIALIPRGLRRFALAALALLLLGAGAWFLLLRPAVKSAAQQAVEQPLAQVAEKADTADQKADAAGVDAQDAKDVLTGKKKTTNEGEKAIVTPPAATGGGGTTSSPVQVKLQTNLPAGATPRNDTLTIKEKTTLIVTDIVLQNPQGDTGRVDVVVDGTPILTLSLANFRDLDYHFVSAVEIPEKKTLTLRTTCQTPGQPIVGTTAGQCRVFMFATGSNRVRK